MTRVAPACAMFAGICFAIFTGPLVAADGETRTWTDSTGKFKVAARFVSVEEDLVTLEREDGTQLEIPLNKLSSTDQEFVRELLAADSDNPFKTKDDGPFKRKSKPARSTRTSPAQDAQRPVETRTVQVDWSTAELISLSPPSATWEVEPPQAVQTFDSKPKTAPLPKKSNFFEGIKGIAINPYANKAAVGFVLADPRPTGVTRIVVCDMATGKTSQPASTEGQMVPLAIDDDGRHVVMRREEFGFGNLDRLEVWVLRGAQVVRSVVWIPYDDVQGGARDVMWAEFLDNDHLATSSRAGKVAVWSFPEIEPLYTFTLVDGAVPALSPDRRWIAYSNGTEMGLFDVHQRQVVAQQATPDRLQWPYMAFSPSGRRIGCIAFDKVLMWDVASGQLESMIPCPGTPIHGAIDFPDENFILGAGKVLIDLENQLRLWTYDGHEQVRSVGGWTFFGVTDGDKPGALVAAQVPHPPAKDLLKKALTDPELFVLKAGTTVKLDLSGIPDPAQRNQVQQALAKRLQAIGCQVDPMGSIDLLASMEGPKQREISFFGSGDYKVQEYIGRVRFVYRGQPAWETSGTNVPFVVSLKQGENIEGHLRQREKPDYTFFDHVELPKFLQKPAAGQGATNSLTLGQSRVTPAGLR